MLIRCSSSKHSIRVFVSGGAMLAGYTMAKKSVCLMYSEAVGKHQTGEMGDAG